MRPDPPPATGAAPLPPVREWQGRSLLWLSIGVIVGSGLAVGVALMALRAKTLSEARMRNEALAVAIEEQTVRTLQAVDLKLQIASRVLDPASRREPVAEPEARSFLRAQIRDMPFVRAIWVLDAEGRIVHDSDVGNMGRTLADRPYFMVHRQQLPPDFYVGDPIVSRTMGGWMINLSRPLAPEGRPFSGVIVAALAPEWFGQLWGAAGLGAADAVALARQDGTLLMRSPLDVTALGKSLAGLPIFQPPLRTAARGSLELVSPLDGVRRLVVFRQLSSHPDLRVVIGLGLDEVLAPWRRMAAIVTLGWLAASAVIALLVWRVSVDFARRFAAEQAMRNSTEKLQLALSGGDLGLWDWDAATGALAVNERWLTMLGLDPTGPPPTLESWHARVHRDDLPKLERLVQEVILDPAGRTFEVDVRARHADGREIWILDRGAVVERHADGRPLRVAGTHLDITEAKRAEQALIDSKNFNDAVINSLSKQIVVLDRHGVIVAANEAWRRLTSQSLGIARNEPMGVGVDYLDRLEADARGSDTEAGALASGIRSVLRGEVQEFRLDRARADAPGTRWFQVNVVPLMTAGGGAVVSHTDITDRVEAENALRDSEQRYRELFDGNPQPMWLFDMQTLRFLAVNDVAVAQYGYSREEFLALTILDIRPPQDASRLQDYLAEQRRGSPVPNIWTHRRKDGSLLQVEIASHAVRHGERDARLVLATDVTARLEAESERARLTAELERHRDRLGELVAERTAELAAARQQAEAANRAKSAFLANMSHEIRTPLNGIIGLNYLVRREPLSATQAARLDKVDAAGQHLLAIINDVLDLSKIEAGREMLESCDFPVTSVLGGVQSLIAEAAQAKSLSIRVERNGVPEWLRGDPTRLRQALLNFAGNAVKFTETGGVVLRAELVEQAQDSLLVRFSVEDSGIGIAPELLPQLFQPFEQADTSITRKYGGTGLGLAITRRLALLMGGQCGAESRPGAGSTFWFTARLGRGQGMPEDLDPGDVGDPAQLLRQRHTGARVLLAEDNPVNLEVAEAVLADVGLQVDSATNGLEALALARTRHYDVVLMDMQMPDMGGLEATQAIRKLAGWQAPPILALTANAFEDDRQRCLAAGMDDIITKPVEARQLYLSLLRWLGSKAAMA